MRAQERYALGDIAKAYGEMDENRDVVSIESIFGRKYAYKNKDTIIADFDYWNHRFNSAEMRAKYALKDYVGAVAAAKKVLGIKPDDKTAAQVLADARAKLEE